MSETLCFIIPLVNGRCSLFGVTKQPSHSLS